MDVVSQASVVDLMTAAILMSWTGLHTDSHTVHKKMKGLSAANQTGPVYLCCLFKEHSQHSSDYLPLARNYSLQIYTKCMSADLQDKFNEFDIHIIQHLHVYC